MRYVRTVHGLGTVLVFIVHYSDLWAGSAHTHMLAAHVSGSILGNRI